MKPVKISTLLYWIFLNIMLLIAFDLAMFMQTTLKGDDATFYNKLLTSEFWATIEWFFVVPANRLGNTFLNPAQISLSSYIFDFIGQIVSNKYWLNVPTTLDDYIGMIIIIVAMSFSTFRTFG
jgi:uncharacterized protein (DUF486 family)